MAGSQIDYKAVFRSIPSPILLMTPELIIADMNQAQLQTTGRSREDLLGRHLFDAFPENPSDPAATGVSVMNASLRRIMETGKSDAVPVQKYDLEVPGSPGQFAKRYWSTTNAPVFGPDGQVVLIMTCVEEVTDRLRRFIELQTADLDD
jgi:PAS domain S-box-containing protein